jgi:hypothetical protein
MLQPTGHSGQTQSLQLCITTAGIYLICGYYVASSTLDRDTEQNSKALLQFAVFGVVVAAPNNGL